MRNTVLLSSGNSWLFSFLPCPWHIVLNSLDFLVEIIHSVSWCCCELVISFLTTCEVLLMLLYLCKFDLNAITAALVPLQLCKPCILAAKLVLVSSAKKAFTTYLSLWLSRYFKARAYDGWMRLWTISFICTSLLLSKIVVIAQNTTERLQLFSVRYAVLYT